MGEKIESPTRAPLNIGSSKKKLSPQLKPPLKSQVKKKSPPGAKSGGPRKSWKSLGSWQHLGSLQFWHQRTGAVFYSPIEDQEEYWGCKDKTNNMQHKTFIVMTALKLNKIKLKFLCDSGDFVFFQSKKTKSLFGTLVALLFSKPEKKKNFWGLQLKKTSYRTGYLNTQKTIPNTNTTIRSNYLNSIWIPNYLSHPGLWNSLY